MSTVLITGASSGFGRACANKYVQEGHKVILTARRKERLDELVTVLGENAVALELDVRDRDGVAIIQDKIPAAFKDIDILINNAGLALGIGGAHEASIDDWDTMVDTNVKGMMYLCRAILPGMVERGGGHIVTLGSVAASWPYPGGNAYGGTKAFVQQFARNMRVDLMGKNIRVSNIEPGMCETEFSVVRFQGDQSKADKVYEGMKALSAEDIAEIIYWTTALPPHINVNQLEVMPVAQTWNAFAVHREELFTE
ncbi:MAG: 3-hydroxy acid dehydrogenase/malonic semialdehyde reductase [Candidatus Azotimanducaceae bacterium]|jgi:3-hydroxy acid dehydrogenase/malonic semialdehyde reductase